MVIAALILGWVLHWAVSRGRPRYRGPLGYAVVCYDLASAARVCVHPGARIWFLGSDGPKRVPVQDVLTALERARREGCY